MRNVSNDMPPGREQANYFPLGKQWWQMIPEKNFKTRSRKKRALPIKGGPFAKDRQQEKS